MCEHKNLRTINDMLICKDCGQKLPLSFLTDRGKKKGKDADPAPVVQSATPPDENPQEQSNPAEILAENPSVESQTGKTTSEKKTRKNAKKGA